MPQRIQTRSRAHRRRVLAGDPLLRDLVYFFRFEEASGHRRDSGPNGFIATDNNTVGQGAGRAGVGFAADFERDNSEFLTVADAALLRLGTFDFSWSFWFNQESRPTAGQSNVAIFVGKDNGTRREYNIQITAADLIKVGFFRSDVFLAELASPSAISDPLNAWHHVAIWYESSSLTARLAVDNGTAASVVLPDQPAASDVPQSLVLGDRSSAPQLLFDGRIDALGFWRRQFTDAERTRLFNGGNGLEWPFR